ncbi:MULTISPECIES: CRISPR-associated endonuclease Cas2 [Rhodobacterales]|uniref:CRISPR-associated endonuclease Cas2 n=1 Tax=Rhodobacterales TaxID=204455 RepID=UPI001108BC79|nr:MULTISPECIES: CRISPR-associated endonuclease Cas2 [Rhodobacterales]
MFIIVTYDVKADRTEKYRKMLSRYLVHQQNSVFAGLITGSRRRAIDKDLRRLLMTGDKVCIFEVENRHNIDASEMTREGKIVASRPLSELVEKSIVL